MSSEIYKAQSSLDVRIDDIRRPITPMTRDRKATRRRSVWLIVAWVKSPLTISVKLWLKVAIVEYIDGRMLDSMFSKPRLFPEIEPTRHPSECPRPTPLHQRPAVTFGIVMSNLNRYQMNTESCLAHIPVPPMTVQFIVDDLGGQS